MGFCRRVLKALPLLLDLLLVITFFILDVRDLYYKIVYMGPYNSFSFYAISQRTLETKPLALKSNFSVDLLPRKSGWPSLLTRCDHLQAASPFFFIGAMGINCTIGSLHNSTVVPKLYLSSSVRPDSMAWAGCKLLHRHRRPPFCYDEVVTKFTERYGFEDIEPSPDMLAAAMSDTEDELLMLLDVIAQSQPIYLATCVEGFIYSGPDFYTTHIFGCGAPNVEKSALVGYHASAFRLLHQDKAWLTVDSINLMEFKYTLRQNVKSEFSASLSADGTQIKLAPKTVTNFSSSGSLYVLMITIDVILMLFNLWSSVEIARLMILPLVATYLGNRSSRLALNDVIDDYKTVLTCPLYRSRPIVLLTVATQLISWVIVLPNSIIFTWSTSSQVAKVQAYLSSLRLWVLILVLFNELWDWFVFFHERLAYAVASKTFVASHEIIAIAAIVSYLKRKDVFAVTGIKYESERQRYRDTTSFVGMTAFGNSYNPQLDGVLYTPTRQLWTIYQPLIVIVLWSLLAVVLVLLVRFFTLAMWTMAVRWRLTRRTAAKPRSRRVTAINTTHGHQEQGLQDSENANMLFTKRSTSALETRSPTPAQARSSRSSRSSRRLTASLHDTGILDVECPYIYARLPLEELLNDPIRARSLVRSSCSIESVMRQRGGASERLETLRFIRAPYVLEHGVVLDRGVMRSRHGFFRSLQPSLPAGLYVAPGTAEAFPRLDKPSRSGGGSESKQEE